MKKKKKKDLKTDAFFPTLTKNVSLFIGTFPGGSDSKIFVCNAEEPGLIPGLERSLEKGKATLSSILAWRTPWIVRGGKKLDKTEQPTFHFTVCELHFNLKNLKTHMDFLKTPLKNI